jgi:hypothetical protein
MSLSVSSFSTEQLLVIQSLVSNALNGTPSAAGKTLIGKNGKPVKLTKSGKVSKRSGKPTVHADFTKHILAAHKDEVAAYKAEHPDQKGAHLSFAANYRKEHAEEFATFSAQWLLEHPKTDSDADVSDAASVASGEASDAPAATTEANGEKVKKARKPLTDEHKAAMQAGRQKKKAEKEAAAAAAESAAKSGIAPVAAPAAPVVDAPAPAPAPKKQVKQAKKADAPAPAPAPKAPEPLPESPKEEEADDEFIPFTLAGKKYVRLGQRRTDGNHIWASGDLWESKKGQKGDWVGVLQEMPDGSSKIDNSGEEPELE